jgi:hydrogenase/urease accessory protein HupE
VDCGPGGLVGEKVGAAGLAESGTDVLLHITLADGRVVRALLSEDAAEFRIPQRERAGDVLRAYARLGVEHLLGGLDHVLFVAGLTLLLSGRRLLGAVTGFTIGHSITLALATLGWVRLPVGLVELGVAASLVALGLELSRATRLRPIARAPLTAALGFGLLHGLGFAAVLADVGLPSGSIPLALFAFNIGVESGQLLLIAALLPGLLALDRARHSWPTLVTQAPATALGSLGVFLLLDRAARLL